MNKKPTYEELEQRVKDLEKEAVARGRLEERMRLLSLAMAQSGEGIAVVDLNGNLEILNDAFAKMHGYSVEELIGKNISIFHTPQQMPSVEAANQQIKETGDFKGEIWHVGRDGTVFPTMMHNSLIRDTEGNPIGLIGTLRDINETMQTEEVLRKERDKVQAYLDIAGVIIVVLNADQSVAVINKKGCEILGYEESEIIGKKWFDNFLPEGDRNKTSAGFFELIAGNIEPVEYFENYVLTKDNKEKLIAWHNSILRDDGGEIIATLSSGEDITERKRAEDALQESEEKYRTLLENLPQKIFFKDRDLIYLSCNENYARDLNIKAGEITRKTDYDFYPKELAEKYREDDKRIMESGKTEEIEEKYLLQDGQNVLVHTVKTPVKDEQGNVIGVLGIFWDITERKRIEDQIQSSLKEKEVL